MTTTFTPGQRVTCTGNTYGNWEGESGTVEATPAPFVGRPELAGTVWVYMDFQAADHAANPQYARPVPVGLDPGQLVPEEA